jgi:hypothetical protein
VWSRPRPNAFLASQTCHGLGGPALVSGHGAGNQIGDGRRIGRLARRGIASTLYVMRLADRARLARHRNRAALFP